MSNYFFITHEEHTLTEIADAIWGAVAAVDPSTDGPAVIGISFAFPHLNYVQGYVYGTPDLAYGGVPCGKVQGQEYFYIVTPVAGEVIDIYMRDHRVKEFAVTIPEWLTHERPDLEQRLDAAIRWAADEFSGDVVFDRDSMADYAATLGR